MLPAWRGRTIHDIKRRDVIALVEAVAEGRPILANRTLRVLSKWFSWLVGRDMIVASPCAGVERPSKEIARDRILSDDEIKRLWSACDVLDDRTAACVRLMLLLGQRRNEIAHMHWSEITGNVWTLAPARTKNNRQHTVPLPRQALEIIEALPRVGDYVLRPLGNRGHAKRTIDAVMKPATRWVFHDLRRTAASGMSRLGARTEAVERALNHVSGAFGGITGVYQRDDLADAKRDALQWWADHVEAVVRGEPAGNVVRMRG